MQQVQCEEIRVIVQRIRMFDFAENFWNAIKAPTEESPTAEDLNAVHAGAVVSMHLSTDLIHS